MLPRAHSDSRVVEGVGNAAVVSGGANVQPSKPPEWQRYINDIISGKSYEGGGRGCRSAESCTSPASSASGGSPPPSTPSRKSQVQATDCDSGPKLDGVAFVADSEINRLGGGSRPYCPSRYEEHRSDTPVASVSSGAGNSEKAAQLRSQIRALQQRRSRQAAVADVADTQNPGESKPTRTPPPRGGNTASVTALEREGRASDSLTPAKSTALSRLQMQMARRESSGDPGAQSCNVVRPTSAGNPTHVPRRPPENESRGEEASDKLSSIMNFLDEVEESSRADVSSLCSARSSQPPRQQLFHDSGVADGAHAVDGRQQRWHSAANPCLIGDQAMLQSRVSLLEIEVRDKKSIIETLKGALADTRTREKEAVINVAKEWEEKMRSQRVQHEASMERHLKLVDRLLNDKTELTKRCELFTEELKAVERKFQMKMEELDGQSSKELSRHKQNWMSAEKLRREAWETEKVKEIKERTIKGLQPEVERILAERKEEKQRLEDRHREALETQRRELLEMGQGQVRDAREQLLREQERVLEQERVAHRRRLQEEFERCSSQLQEERARCAADLLAEKRRSEQARHQGAEELDKQVREALAAQRTASEAAQQETRKAALAAEERHRAELEAVREQHRIDLDKKRQEQEAQARGELERSAAAIRLELTKERDQQLNVLMERLSREHVEDQHAAKQEAAEAVDKVRKAADEVKGRLAADLEEARGQVSRLEADKSRLEETVRSLQQHVEQVSRRAAASEELSGNHESERIKAQRESERALEELREDAQRAEEAHARELERVREEQRCLSADLAEERSRAEAQVAEASRREAQIIGDLEARVKRALHAKDDTIGELRARCVASDNKVREFEYLLARQREELLSGITKSAH
eukprot:TRINITY_DN56076_c0_g1_i1.p1 TRINITY_DN56076_c0_g1~~TRINITY_DN56076_c0_g1_i1.p1  ORF type:complete len:879 (-),score=203.85 TRINITY_DN56076_c0_g1_i1:44-2680(-)